MRKKILALCLLSTAIFASSNLLAAQKCELNNTCNLVGTSDYVYFSFNKDDGINYVCDLKATSDRDVSVRITPGKDFKFSPRNVTVPKGNAKSEVKIDDGNFASGKTEGEIQVWQTVSLNAEGTVNCHVGK